MNFKAFFDTSAHHHNDDKWTEVHEDFHRTYKEATAQQKHTMESRFNEKASQYEDDTPEGRTDLTRIVNEIIREISAAGI